VDEVIKSVLRKLRMRAFDCLCILLSSVGHLIEFLFNRWFAILLGKDGHDEFFKSLVGSYRQLLSKFFISRYSGFFIPLNKDEVLITFDGFFAVVPINTIGITHIVEKEYLQPSKGDVVVDAGAHYGFYTLHASRLVGAEGMILSFEPHPKNYERFLTNLSSNGIMNVMPFNKALGQCDRPIRLYVSSHSERHSTSFRLNPSTHYSGNYIYVESARLDTVVDELGIKRVDLIKIDVEGAELSILKGAEKTIYQFKPSLTIAAYHYPEEVDEICALLKRMNLSYKVIITQGPILHAIYS
jgi:FkbM family methyltransferase